MNVFKVWFLYNQGLINQQLFKVLRNSTTGQEVVKELKCELTSINFSKCLTWIFLFAATLTLGQPLIFDNNHMWTESLFIIAIFSIIICIIVDTTSVAKEILKLNDSLAVYRGEDGKFQKYNLNQDWDWLSRKANATLLCRARELLLSELHDGVDTKSTVKKRKAFKTDHAIFAKFDLCEKNQGIYIKAVRDSVLDGLKEKTC